ncbi:MAG: hypothetical protein A3F67_01790 [Verrucomicrobia bacterium RIFCSPHIGHO2_12_FULL_41_10]|nr:MAG: hypothetical protein A3F67_01790 [Verrucomicrobia bacterium RIFCSPHIGHO2_12_FULL_41_10]HLB34015.1 PIN domain-containing protein [Chthoniobacterales bacterium]
MDQIIDSCIWVDHLRTTTKAPLRFLANEIISRPSVAICAPIHFELLRLIPQEARKRVEDILAIIPMLLTPAGLWHQATRNGQRCRDKGIQTGAMDLLIATICQHHQATLVTFDTTFEKMAKVFQFNVEVIEKY